jgi:hypothetical protein
MEVFLCGLVSAGSVFCDWVAWYAVLDIVFDSRNVVVIVVELVAIRVLDAR